MAVLFVISCSQNDEITQVEAKNEFGLTQKQMTTLGIASAKIYTKGDNEFQELARGFTERMNANSINKEARTEVMVPPPPTPQEIATIVNITILGNGGYGGANGAIVWFVQNVNSPDEYFTEIHPSNNRPTKLLWTKITPRASYPFVRPPFTYQNYTYPGHVLISPQNGLGENASWWGCVQGEFSAMCMANPLRELMCAAAGAYAPELFLVVYASWMISCI